MCTVSIIGGVFTHTHANIYQRLTLRATWPIGKKMSSKIKREKRAGQRRERERERKLSDSEPQTIKNQFSMISQMLRGLMGKWELDLARLLRH